MSDKTYNWSDYYINTVEPAGGTPSIMKIVNAYDDDGTLYQEAQNRVSHALDNVGNTDWTNEQKLAATASAMAYQMALLGGDYSMSAEERERVLQNHKYLEKQYKALINPSTPVRIYSNATDAAYASAEAARKEAERLAEKNRQDSIKNAYAIHDMSVATYGQNAEALAQMGLTNSGQSDYITASAYGNLVSGIENANNIAAETVLKAAYEENQAKLAADMKHIENQQKLEAAQKEAEAAEKKAYQDRLASIISAVGLGEINEEQARAIAEAYNLNEDDIAKVSDVAKGYGTKVKENAVTYLTDAIKNGIADEDGNITYLTEEQIRNYGKQNGLSEEEINEFVTNNADNASKQIIDTYKYQITADTTYEDIDALDLSDTEKTSLKAEVDKKVYDNELKKLQSEISSGNIGLGNLAEIDQKYAQKNLGEDTYQHIYFDRALAFAQGIENLDEYEEALKQIDGYVSQDKMTSENAEKAKKYIANTVATVLPSGLCSIEATAGSSYRYIKIGDDIYDLEVYLGAKASESEQKIIDDVVAENEAGIVVIGDNVYLKKSYPNKKHYNAIRNGETKEILLSLAKTSINTPTKPTYTPIKE